MKEIFKSIPVYPDEITINEIAKKTGVARDVIFYTLNGLPLFSPVCYQKGKYSFLSKEFKRDFIELYWD